MSESHEPDWKMIVRSLKSSTNPHKKLLIEKVIREEAGEEVPLREARKGLLLMALDALGGNPRLITVHGEGVMVVLGLGDLLEMLAEPGPTLAEVMGRASNRSDESNKLV
jgi:hypothetical protein